MSLHLAHFIYGCMQTQTDVECSTTYFCFFPLLSPRLSLSHFYHSFRFLYISIDLRAQWETSTSAISSQKGEKDLQRFQSRDGAPLQGLRGRYVRKLKRHYICGPTLRLLFQISTILVPHLPVVCPWLISTVGCKSDTSIGNVLHHFLDWMTSSQLYLFNRLIPLRLLVDPENVYTVVYKSLQGVKLDGPQARSVVLTLITAHPH
ncbi:MAG: hypothetical protein BYD32DRAFT_202581 [Podila humilis]|nr:MAG: hypothetical protein BYD32DRAFT_202581 [Podila humilis]